MKFLAVFTGSPESKELLALLDQKTRAEKESSAKKAWIRWAGEHAKSIIDSGAPLGKTKFASASGVSDIENRMGAFTVIEAESYDADAKNFLNHPHFMIFPRDGVEIMECLPMPN